MSAPLNPSTLPHDKKWSEIYATTAVCLFLVTAIVSLRLYTRAHITKQIGIDDWMAIVSLLLVIGSGVSFCVTTQKGLGVHFYDLTDPSPTPFLKVFYVAICTYNATLVAIKATFLIQYYRLVNQVRRLQIICLVLSFTILGWSVAQLFVTIFSCIPVQAFWEVELQATAWCNPKQTGIYLNGAGNMVTDIIIFLMPLPVLRTLALHKHRKMVLFTIFSLGFLTTVISIVRFAYLYVGFDSLYTNADGATLSIAEISVGLICACLPTLRPFFTRYTPWLGSRVGSQATGGYVNTSRRSRRGYRQQEDGIIPSRHSAKSSAGEYEMNLGWGRNTRSESELVHEHERSGLESNIR